MSINSQLVIESIIDAYKNAIDTKIDANSIGNLHGKRSKNFIDNITENLENLYDDNGIVVFSSSKENTDFKRHEFLYDINVCKVNKLNNKTSIKYIEKSLIQIESELERKTRPVAIDFSKLVCGNSELKIMIISKVSKDKDFRESLKPIAANIKQELYLIQIEHPENWDVCDKESYNIYKYSNGWIDTKDMCISKNYYI